VDPNTIPPAITSYMDWPEHNQAGKVTQQGAKVGWLIGSAVNCKKVECKSTDWLNTDKMKCKEPMQPIFD
jgi:hypothetical protein